MPATTPAVKTVPKLIEVALPLEAINKAAAREKSIRHGHPSTLHLWWARRPLAAARAVLFAQLVDDPSGRPERFPTKKEQDAERKRLFALMEKLVLWENTNNEAVLGAARAEIRESWRRACEDNRDHPRAGELFDPETLPAFHDPFAGGGAIPLEAQRLGLEAHASDLNPVAVLINKAMIEVPPRFAGRPPVHPGTRGGRLTGKAWKGAAGLAEDVRRYGAWMREEAERRIGHLYPKVAVTKAMAADRPDLGRYVGRELTVIAWLWARTAPSPNPAFAGVAVPLASSFVLSTKAGKAAWIEPAVEGSEYRFRVRRGTPPPEAKSGTKLGRGANFRCLVSGVGMTPGYLKAEGKAGRMSARLMAVVAEGDRERVYLDATDDQELAAIGVEPNWRPEAPMPRDRRWFSPPLYGMPMFGDLFTSRQLVALTTFSDLVGEAMARVRRDAVIAGCNDDDRPLRDGGTGAAAYAHAVALYLAFAVDRLAMSGNSLVRWNAVGAKAQHCFGRQAMPMVWDYAEPNFLARATGSIDAGVACAADPLTVGIAAELHGDAIQADATCWRVSTRRIVSTDPPYYDNIGYADLSDFFYVWLRRSLKTVFPDLFATLAVPKSEELVATPYRQGSKEKAEAFFLAGMTKALSRLAEQVHPVEPVSIYYAFKQSETKGDSGTASTGWETFLDATIHSGFEITGTWPLRTEMGTRMVGMGTNALASSIVLACRPRDPDAALASLRQFRTALEAELPPAIRLLQSGNIAPVDLAQAAIGPGMAIYTRHAGVQRASGEPVTVREALALINEVLDEVVREHEGELDAPTRWALEWFEQHGFSEGLYGDAETISKAKATTVARLAAAGIVRSAAGKVRLVPPDDLSDDWDPVENAPAPAWAAVHHLTRRLATGEDAAAALLRRLGGTAETARELAYRLYVIAERKKWAEDALRYNGLVQSWRKLEQKAREESVGRTAGTLGLGNTGE